MALLTINPTVAADADGAPFFIEGYRTNDVRRRHITSSAGTTLTPIQVGIASKRHIIVAGRITVEAAGTIEIYSETTLRDQIEFPAAGTALWPKGFECETEEDLAIKNPDGLTCVGWIAWITITDGLTVPASLLS